MKAQNYLLMLLLSVLLASTLTVTEAYGSSTTYTWYFCSSTHTVHGLTAYQLNETNTDTDEIINQELSGNVTVTYGIRVWKRDSSGNEQEITSGSPVATFTVTPNSYGQKQRTWQPTSVDVCNETIVVRIYVKPENGAWQTLAVFSTNPLFPSLPKKLSTATWNITYRYSALYSSATNKTTAGITFGDSSNQMKIENITFEDLNPYEQMMHWLNQGNFVKALETPFTSQSSILVTTNFFYSTMLLLCCVTLYNRYKNVNIILLLFILFGGTGGVLTAIMPASGLWISWLIFVLGLGGLLYRLFKTT